MVKLPLQVIISSVDLSNAEFKRVVKLYEEFGNVMRVRYRNVRERKLAQILHPQIVDKCIFTSICDYALRNQRNSIFSIFIDNWAIPQDDVSIYLKDRSHSLETEINSLYEKIYSPIQISVPSIELLNKDNYRKRYIGVVASAISRSFLEEENERYSQHPFETITSIDNNKYFEITSELIGELKDIMDDISRNPPIL